MIRLRRLTLAFPMHEIRLSHLQFLSLVLLRKRGFEKTRNLFQNPGDFSPITVSKTVSMKNFTGYLIIKVMVEQNRFIAGFY